MGTIYGMGSFEAALSRMVGKTVWAAYKTGLMINQAVAVVVTWQDRRRERRQLLELDTRLLRDIGLARVDIDLETRKPFWRG